jgi:hypothetical protein
MRPSLSSAAAVVLVTVSSAVMTATDSSAQRAPLVGSVSPGAVGPAIQQPAPIGGLRGVPLSSARRVQGVRVVETRFSDSAPGNARNRRPGLPWGFDRGVRVLDAPLPRGLATGGGYAGDAATLAPRWMPSYDAPRWVPDSTAAASTLWRDLLVTDVVCSIAGACRERTQRVRARWLARCDCYAFSDGWNRLWRVGERPRAPEATRAPSPIRMVRTDTGAIELRKP